MYSTFSISLSLSLALCPRWGERKVCILLTGSFLFVFFCFCVCFFHLYSFSLAPNYPMLESKFPVNPSKTSFVSPGSPLSSTVVFKFFSLYPFFPSCFSCALFLILRPPSGNFCTLTETPFPPPYHLGKGRGRGVLILFRTKSFSWLATYCASEPLARIPISPFSA